MGELFEFAALLIILCAVFLVLWKLVTVIRNRSETKKSGSEEQSSPEEGQKRKSE